ncbi:HAMP domain-containing histidine kinase [Virgibacillus sp. MSP4-1]|uniref:sensor histidine kinase n=1 Tax=Virgibacillus sp. MSP4-1 TaxID=2700081 RepID=UPI0003AB03C2|nr:HAMP domain-containing sensor histidine kinase [Virgibacillus sp. MSP4-1]QHS21506.1 HAMP domain-containing histidine kinase [Virgibacillus sp. MSP4-1]
MNKWKIIRFPRRLLGRLTLINITVVTAFIFLTSWATYHTACFLVDGIGTMNQMTQKQFESTLLQYLWIFSFSTIILGSMIQFFLTKKLTGPLRKLIDSTKTMKEGRYPSPIQTRSQDETGQLIDHFNDMVEQLKKNEQQRKKMISDLSHELRTPLANLNGYLNALHNGVIEGSPKLYKALYEESNRLSGMLEQLDRLKEWDDISGQTFSERKMIDMKSIIKQTVEMFHWSAEKKGIPVKHQLDAGVVQVNQEGIAQVLNNLLDNAIRYHQGRGPIIVRGIRSEREYYVSFTGPGEVIPEREQSLIFERFYRTDPSRSRESGGTGLGLAISKEIIEHHRGQIGVHSEDHLHSFWFTLPLVKES